MNLLRTLVLAAAIVSATRGAVAQATTDVEYARVGEHSLKLDLYLNPEKNQPLLVCVHGGAWRGGSKENPPILPLQSQGFAIASINYRLTVDAPFPANVHDIKAAIRFLRAKAPDYGYDATRIGILGSSAGGHLAALVGVTNRHKELEGRVGEHLDQSSEVQCIVSLFGASNLQTILSQSTPHGLKMREPALQLLLDGQPEEKPELAELASPVAHLQKGDPPLLLVHGDADPQMPFEQSQEFVKAYEALQLPVQFVVIPGGEHGGPEFYDVERTAIMAEFLRKHLNPP